MKVLEGERMEHEARLKKLGGVMAASKKEKKKFGKTTILPPKRPIYYNFVDAMVPTLQAHYTIIQ